MKKYKVVIVGGGFGGVKSALELAKRPEFEITLVANKPFFEYYPMMYHTASGGSSSVSSIPLGEIFKNKKIKIIISEAKKLNRKNKTIALKNGNTLPYQALIIAIGSVTNYFGIEGLDKHSYGVKTLSDTEKLKAHLHSNIVSKEKGSDKYVVIGGGPTGIEIASALPEYIKFLRKKHGIKTKTKPKVELIEAGPRLMSRMPKKMSRKVAHRMRSLGVKLTFKRPVQLESADTLLVDGKPLKTKTIIWTAGLANNPFFKANSFMLSDNNKVKVDRLMQAWPGVFIIGDNADTEFSGMAQTALHDALFVSSNLIRHVDGLKPYAYTAKKPIYVTPVGKYWAAVLWGRLELYGITGWVLRKFADLLGYKDVEPWWRATKRIMDDNLREDNCLVCSTNVSSIE